MGIASPSYVCPDCQNKSIKQIVRSYICNKNAIILAVTPLAGVPDLDNSAAIEIAREARGRVSARFYIQHPYTLPLPEPTLSVALAQ